MKFLNINYILQLVVILISLAIVSCKNHSVRIISFEVKNITPGRTEQNKFSSYTLKFVNEEKVLVANSIKILFNDEFEITPSQFNHNDNNAYKKGDTVHCAFSIQEQYMSNQSYILKYNNSKKERLKKISQPLLNNNTNIPKQ